MTFLTSAAGDDLIREAESLANEGADSLRALTRLRKSVSTEEATSAWELVGVRRRAVAKFGPDAAKMFFDRDGYEMASSMGCAEYHTKLLVEAGVGHVVDLCAGVGFDSCRFALAGIRVTAYEIDSSRAEFARANANALGVGHLVEVITADATRVAFPASATTAFFDPARRAGGRKRIVAPEDLVPPLTLLSELAERGIESALTKLSPAIDRGLGLQFGASTEFLSDGGECKEALLRTGNLANGTGISATLLSKSLRLDGPAVQPRIVSRISGFVYDPDPAVIRAGLVGFVAQDVEGWLLDPDIAYVFSDSLLMTPYATGYRIVASFPFHIKALQRALNEHNAGRVIVKKRGFPQEPEEIRKQLKLTGSLEATLVLTREGKRLWAMIVDRA